MIHKSLSPFQDNPQGRIRVTFELPSCTWACRIFVCGDFNDWSTSTLQMRQERDGVWRARMDLAPNRKYYFRYLIDGNWQTDYHTDGWSESGYGSENSILDTGILPELSPEELAALAEPVTLITTAPPMRTGDLNLHRIPYPTPPLVIEERATVAQRPVTQPAHAVRRAA